MSLNQDVSQFLEATFPGSTLHDGYFYVVIKAVHERRVRHDAYQEVVDKLCEARCWIVCVGTDPSSAVRATRIEKQSVTYNPDWNVSEERSQWLLEVDRSRFTLSDITSGMTPNSALVLIDPDRRIAFNVNFGELYASTSRDLDAFSEGLEACFVAAAE